MTGPEHYREAEHRERASDYAWQESTDVITALGALREATLAQAHATLALAAATAQQLADRYVGDGDHINAWQATVAATAVSA